MFALIALFLAADPSIPFNRFVLDNGLEVIVNEDHHLPIVAVNMTYHVGSVDEPRTRTGFAHLFEHLMFQGSRHIASNDHMRLLTDAGASFVNGSTHFDYTDYVEDVPSNQLELAFWLESDRMGYLLDTLDQKKLDNQRDVVKNERRQRYENAPYGQVFEVTLRNLFPNTHPYHSSPIGSMAHLDAATIDDVKNFFRTYYVPANATLVLSGDVTLAQAKMLADKYFAPIAKRPAPKRVAIVAPLKPGQQKIVVDEHLGKLARVNYAWIAPPFFAPDDAALDFVGTTLSEGKSSRLYKALVREKKIAQSVEASEQSLGASSMFVISATAQPGVDCKTLDAAMSEVMADLLAHPPTDAELQRTKNRFETQFVGNLQSLHGRASLLQSFNHYRHDPGAADFEFARHRKLTATDLASAAAKYLSPEKRLTVWAVPTSEGKPAVLADDAPPPQKNTSAMAALKPLADAPFRQKAPAPGAAPKLQLPAFQRATLANGLNVLVAEDHRLPLVAAAVGLLGGATLDPSDKAGLAQLTFDLLDEGAAGKDALQLDDALANIGTELHAVSGRDGGFVAMVVLKNNVPTAMSLLGDVVLHPTFAAADVDRLRDEHISHWVASTANAPRMGLEQILTTVYGKGTPYGHPQQGTDVSLRAISRDDIVGFHKREFGPDRAAIVLVGDVTLAEAKDAAQKVFGDWKKSTHTEIAKVAAPKALAATAKKTLAIYPRPHAPQTFIALGALAMPAGAPDEEALDLASAAFGGEFNSRLNMNLREEKGITYGASSHLDAARQAGIVTITTSVRAEDTAVGVKEIFAELQKLKSKPLSADELGFVKNAAILSLPGRFDGLGQVAESAAHLFLFNLPLDFYQSEQARTEAVTLAEAQKSAEKYFAADGLHVVLVGDPDLLKAQLGQDYDLQMLSPLVPTPAANKGGAR